MSEATSTARIRTALEAVAFNETATSGRALIAKTQALRTLQRMDDGAAASVDDLVDDDGRWHPGPPEFWPLDRGDTDEHRERWRRSWEERFGEQPHG